MKWAWFVYDFHPQFRGPIVWPQRLIEATICSTTSCPCWADSKNTWIVQIGPVQPKILQKNALHSAVPHESSVALLQLDPIFAANFDFTLAPSNLPQSRSTASLQSQIWIRSDSGLKTLKIIFISDTANLAWTDHAILMLWDRPCHCNFTLAPSNLPQTRSTAESDLGQIRLCIEDSENHLHFRHSQTRLGPSLFLPFPDLILRRL